MWRDVDPGTGHTEQEQHHQEDGQDIDFDGILVALQCPVRRDGCILQPILEAAELAGAPAELPDALEQMTPGWFETEIAAGTGDYDGLPGAVSLVIWKVRELVLPGLEEQLLLYGPWEFNRHDWARCVSIVGTRTIRET
jgi:hypothetical protein